MSQDVAVPDGKPSQARIPSKKRTVLSAISALATRMGGALAALLLTFYLARTMGAAEVGRFYLCVNILLGLSMIGRLGMDTTLMRFAGPLWEIGDCKGLLGVLLQGLVFVLPLTIGLALLLGFAGPWLATHVFGDAALVDSLMLTALILVPYTLAFPLAGFLKGVRMPSLAGFVERAGLPTMTIVIVAAAASFGPMDATATLAAYGLGTLVLLTVGASAAGHFVRSASGHQFLPAGQMLETCLPIMWASLFSYFINWSASVVLAVFVTPDEVGLFNIALRAVNAIGLAIVAFNSVTAPRFPGLHQRGDLKGLERLASRSALSMLAAGAPLIVVFLFAPSEVLAIFGEEFSAGSTILVILTFGQVINLATGSVGDLLAMTGHQRVMRNIVAATAVVSLALNFILIPLYGALGAAVAASVSLASLNIAATWFVFRYLKIVVFPFFPVSFKNG